MVSGSWSLVKGIKTGSNLFTYIRTSNFDIRILNQKL